MLSPTERRNILKEGKKEKASAFSIKNDLDLRFSAQEIQHIMSSDALLQQNFPFKHPIYLEVTVQPILTGLVYGMRGLIQNGTAP